MTPFVQTASGRAFKFGKPDASAVLLSDIATHLAKINRFAGATKLFYSVAQHSVLVAEQLADVPMLALFGLVHDAHEAYIGDMPTPFQRHLANRTGFDWISFIKREVDQTIHRALGLPPLASGSAYDMAVREADRRVFATERRDLMVETGLDWGDMAAPLPTPIHSCWAWTKAEEKFLAAWDRYAVLTDVPMARRRVA